MAIIGDVTVRAPNSVILVGDPRREPPEAMLGAVVAAAAASVAVGTMSEVDGQARIRLVEPPDDVGERPGFLGFDGTLDLAEGRLAVTNVTGDMYISHRVTEGSPRIRIWLDHPSEPQDIYVLVG
jgi:hypothetical protein